VGRGAQHDGNAKGIPEPGHESLAEKRLGLGVEEQGHEEAPREIGHGDEGGGAPEFV